MKQLTGFSGIDRAAIANELENWQTAHKVQRLWAGDASLWTNQDESKWLGWLDVATVEQNEVAAIATLATKLQTAGCEHLVVLGMGGSSLCPAMLAQTFGKIAQFPRLHVLDSTDPMQIRHLEESIDLHTTYFIVSSKSGSTLEPNIFQEYFYTRLQTVLDKQLVGDRFIAITDPGTKLATLAQQENFTKLFYGIPSIGGRYSALSNFGMVPAGLMGLDVHNFLQHAQTMAVACGPDVAPADNPGVLLGVLLGVCAKQQQDKVTFIVSPGIHELGAWLEQLVAESTGKLGKGLIPVDQEPLGVPAVYGADRVFVYIRLTKEFDNAQDNAVIALEKANRAVIRLELQDKSHLGAALLQWELAIAVAGSVIGINPFDQPDVEEAKVRALQLTAEYDATGQIFQPEAFFAKNDMKLFTDQRNLQDITQRLDGPASIESYLRAHLSRVQLGDYVDLAAFIEMNAAHTKILQQSRALIRDKKTVATCLGFGPRFLHSTGQAYKGGPNTGVFLQITADHVVDLPVPKHRYTFGLVITAQAQADFEVLTKRSKRFLRIHLDKDVHAGLQQLHNIIQRAL